MKVSSTLPVIVATVVVAVNTNSKHPSGLLSSYYNVAEQPELPRHITNDHGPHYDRATTADSDLTELESRKEHFTHAPHEEKSSPKSEIAPPQPNSNNLRVIRVSSGACGHSGATLETTATTGPNGSLDWMNCGINDGGWRPPKVTVDDIVFEDLSSAVKDPNSPFHACSKFVPIFNKYGDQFHLPPIMLASFAMQESFCVPTTIGAGGEQGLMQITRDKCRGATDEECRNPDFNIKTGTKYFADTLRNNGGDLLLSIGMYNGYQRGLTFGQATAAANSDCCLCQNNLDYLHQFLNGWMQNINAYDTKPRLGKYFNLDRCR